MSSNIFDLNVSIARYNAAMTSPTQKNTKAQIISIASQRSEEEKIDAIEMVKQAEIDKREATINSIQTSNSSTVLNNTRNNTTVISRTDPVYPEKHYNQKSRDAFAN